ncbi:17330_t:CDS:2 [Dentiscutata erythropus]|uniref:Autophagy-related protein n=1 Tax=Dentiscutata erythropus TaxID=1348616 RepID=A0A9N9AU28_9GLOM|nr:17330_t:CDS:2 [Dentiscutata erythropus]
MADTELEIEYENGSSNVQETIFTDITIEEQNSEPILSKKELYAWYLYAFACEVYSVVSLSSFIPLILEQFASEQGFLNINHEIACKNSTELKAFEEVRCVVNIFGLWVDTASFSLYTFSFSVILQAITAISIGATADHGAMRKTLLIIFALVGSVSAMLFLLVTPPMFLLVAIIAIIGNICFGASFVCFNGFLPVLARNHQDGRKIRWFDYVIYAWKQLWMTILQARKLEMTFKFLIAWFFISDGYTTITSVALLFAKTTLQVPAVGLIAISLIVPLSALFGTIMVPKFQSYFRLTTKQTVIFLNVLLLCIPFYGCLGFILPFGGLKSGTELYYFAVWFGIVIGSIQSYCRTLFSELVPRGRETEFFALYAVTDKGSSWLGPTLVAIITDITHEIRFGFVLLFFLVLTPIPILLSLNVSKGKEDADKASNKHSIVI